MSTREGYVYDASWEGERTRLEGLERMNDPMTIERLERVGVASGWSCLEVGGGGGSITRWLCRRVGPGGRVVATDLDTRFLDPIDAANLEVRRHDVVNEPFERDAFDVVHSRFLLEHLPEYRKALDNMIAAVKPGGWVLMEDVDFAVAIFGDPDQLPGVSRREHAEAQVELLRTLYGMAQGRGIQPELGRHLARLLVEAGLEDVGSEGRTQLVWSGSEDAQVARLSVQHLTKVAVDAGIMTVEARQRYIAALADPDVAWFSPLRFAAWGRKPS